MPDTCTLPTGLYYKSEARPISELKRIFHGSMGDTSFEKWLEYRDRARKDLFWLGKRVLKKDLVSCHIESCSLFVPKNFDGVYHNGYTIGEVHKAIGAQQREREMMFLDPRGAYKSTIDGIDAVQWLLNCPDIRILILTGEYKLALAFMSEIKGYFYRPEDTDPTILQQLFPEYILHGKDGTSDQPLNCPARIHITQKEPSLWVNAIVANLSGWHCDVRKMDDVVTDENSNSIDSRAKLKTKIDGTDNLVDEWGFTDIIGTRYFVDDYYGERIRAPKDDAPLKYHCRACWTVKPPFVDTPLLQLRSNMVDLLFPEKLNFKSLRAKLSKNETMFRCQQLNEPAAEGSFITFSEDILRLHLTGIMPKEGRRYIAWDTSYARDDKADYSCGACGVVVQGDPLPELHIVEVIYGKWKPSELIFQMIQFELKHRPDTTLIEETSGSEFLKMELQRVAQIRQCPLHLIWKKPGTEADSKRNRIKSLETLLADDRLYFLMGPWIDETFLQFTRYTGERKNRGRKDDIPDAVSYLQFFVPSTANNEQMKLAMAEAERKARAQSIYNTIFETPAHHAPIPQIAEPSIKRRLFGSLAHV